MEKTYLIFSFFFLATIVGCGSTTDKVEIIEISTVEDLLLLENEVSANYVLTNDIDCGGKKFNSISNFSGTINGQGHVIKNIEFIDEKNSFGLIGNAISTVTIKNLGIENFEINANYECKDLYVGAFVGNAENGIVLENCYSKGKINVQEKTEDNTSIGGLVGYCDGNTKIYNSFSDVDIDAFHAKKNGAGDFCIGGLLGRGTRWSFIENCFFSGSLKYETATLPYHHTVFMAGAAGLPENIASIKNFVNLCDEITCNIDSKYIRPIYGGTYAKESMINNYYCRYKSDLDYETSKFSFILEDSLEAIDIRKNVMASKDFLTGKCYSYNEFNEEISIPCSFSEEVWNMYDYEEGVIKYPTLKVFDLGGNYEKNN